MNTNSNNTDWSPCPSGTLQGLASNLKRQHRNARLRQMGEAAAIVLVIVAGSAYLFNSMYGIGPNNYGGISCAEVKSVLPKYIAGNIDVQIAMKVDQHLTQCHHCKEAYNSMISDSVVSSVPSSPGSTSLPSASNVRAGRFPVSKENFRRLLSQDHRIAAN